MIDIKVISLVRILVWPAHSHCGNKEITVVLPHFSQGKNATTFFFFMNISHIFVSKQNQMLDFILFMKKQDLASVICCLQKNN